MLRQSLVSMCLLVCSPLCGRVMGEDRPAVADRMEPSDISSLLKRASAGTDPDFESMKTRVGLVPGAIAPRDLRSMLTCCGVEFRSLGLEVGFREDELHLMWTTMGRTEFSVDAVKGRLSEKLEALGLERMPNEPDTLFPQQIRFRRMQPGYQALVLPMASRDEGALETTVVIQWYDTAPSQRAHAPLKEILHEVPALGTSLQQVDFLKVIEEKAVTRVSSTFADPRLPDLYRRSLIYMPNHFAISAELDTSSLLENVLPRMKYKRLEQSWNDQGKSSFQRWERRRDRYEIVLLRKGGGELKPEWIEINGVRKLGQNTKP